MRKIAYYVAASLDGFIAGPNEDIGKFISEGNGVQKYLDDLKKFDDVIMGRKTYEFGYKFGLTPGAPAYPHMNHYIFSSSLIFDSPNEKVKAVKPALNFIDRLKNGNGSDIYLCGGGEFAGWLLDNKKIDILKIKLNPIILGDGIKIFGASKSSVKLNLIDSEIYDYGLKILTYAVEYS